jgi:hypothetical protein
MTILDLGGFLAYSTQNRGAGGLLPSIDRYMRSTKAAAIVFLLYVTKSLASDGWLHLSFHSSSGERATLIDYDDVALGGRQISGDIGEKKP